MDFIIVDAPEPVLFAEKVQDKRSGGYELHGAPFAWQGVLCQAMVLPDEEQQREPAVHELVAALGKAMDYMNLEYGSTVDQYSELVAVFNKYYVEVS